MSKGNGMSSRSSSSHKAERQDVRNNEAASPGDDEDAIQGEGDYRAGRNFNASERQFVASGKVAAAAKAAAPKSDVEQKAMLAAERAGKGRAK